MRAELKIDYKANGMTIGKAILGLVTLNPFWLIVLYRLSNWLWWNKVPLLPSVLQAIGKVLYSADISPEAEIGVGIRFAHTVGIVIGPDVWIGEFVQIFQNVTLGGRNKEGMPCIGDHSSVFAGAMVLGPVIVGHSSAIGAGSVVLKDTEACSIMVGNPARSIGTVEESYSMQSMRGYLSDEEIRELVWG